METCQPYACSMVAVFGFLAGTGALAASLSLAFGLGRLHRWLRAKRLQGMLRPVDEAFPTWRNTVTTARYNEWLRKQPNDTQDLAASFKPQDAIEVLRRYEAQR